MSDTKSNKRKGLLAKWNRALLPWSIVPFFPALLSVLHYERDYGEPIPWWLWMHLGVVSILFAWRSHIEYKKWRRAVHRNRLNSKRFEAIEGELKRKRAEQEREELAEKNERYWSPPPAGQAHQIPFTRLTPPTLDGQE